MSCIFCRIIAGEIPAKKVFENEQFIVFHDVYPKAPVHVLVIPKKHIESLAHLDATDLTLMGELTLLLPVLAQDLNLKEGFKVAVNTGTGGGQEVFHLHYHLMGSPVFEI